jgi:hypothetical protein
MGYKNRFRPKGEHSQRVPVSRLRRTPKKGDRVGATGRRGTFVVVEVQQSPQTVDLQLLKATKQIRPIDKGIPWSTLIFLDEEDASQAAVRVVPEATEGL